VDDGRVIIAIIVENGRRVGKARVSSIEAPHGPCRPSGPTTGSGPSYPSGVGDRPGAWQASGIGGRCSALASGRRSIGGRCLLPRCEVELIESRPGRCESSQDRFLAVPLRGYRLGRQSGGGPRFDWTPLTNGRGCVGVPVVANCLDLVGRSRRPTLIVVERPHPVGPGCSCPPCRGGGGPTIAADLRPSF